MNISYILMGMLIITTAISSIIAYWDMWRKRSVKVYPLISFIVPTYNDGDVLETTIQSIISSYDPAKSEIFVINDCSTDNTQQVLQEISGKYPIKIITNFKNKGKAVSINNVADIVHGDIIFIVDSDVLLNKESVDDLVARFQSDPKVGGVSCRYKVRNKHNFLTQMQDVEYCMLSFLQGAYNPFGTVSMWGGCMAFRKEAFLQIGKLSPNFLIEDMDAALKLLEHGWKAEQSFKGVYTNVPDYLSWWYKQKIRWSAGFSQCFLAHTKTYFSNPLAILAALSYTALTFLFIFNIFFNHQLFISIYHLYEAFLGIGINWLVSTLEIFKIYMPYLAQIVIGALLYPIFSIPPLLYDKDYLKPFRILLIYPFSFLYYPLLAIVGVIGYVQGVDKYMKLKQGGRGW